MIQYVILFFYLWYVFHFLFYVFILCFYYYEYIFNMNILLHDPVCVFMYYHVWFSDRVTLNILYLVHILDTGNCRLFLDYLFHWFHWSPSPWDFTDFFQFLGYIQYFIPDLRSVLTKTHCTISLNNYYYLDAVLISLFLLMRVIW